MRILKRILAFSLALILAMTMLPAGMISAYADEGVAKAAATGQTHEHDPEEAADVHDCDDGCLEGSGEAVSDNTLLEDSGGEHESEGSADHKPKNVKIRLMKEETGADGRTYVVSEVSWDEDSEIKMSEMHPFIADKDGNACEYLIKSDGQSIVRDDVDEAGIPEGFRYKVVNGRNIFRLRLPRLKSGESQFYQDSQGRWLCRGLNEGDSAIVFVQSAEKTSEGYNYSDYSDPVIVEITKDNIN